MPRAVPEFKGCRKGVEQNCHLHPRFRFDPRGRAIGDLVLLVSARILRRGRELMVVIAELPRRAHRYMECEADMI